MLTVIHTFLSTLSKVEHISVCNKEPDECQLTNQLLDIATVKMAFRARAELIVHRDYIH